MPSGRDEEIDTVLKLLQEMKDGYLALAERHKKLQDTHIQMLADFADGKFPLRTIEEEGQHSV